MPPDTCKYLELDTFYVNGILFYKDPTRFSLKLVHSRHTKVQLIKTLASYISQIIGIGMLQEVLNNQIFFDFIRWLFISTAMCICLSYLYLLYRIFSNLIRTRI